MAIPVLVYEKQGNHLGSGRHGDTSKTGRNLKNKNRK